MALSAHVWKGGACPWGRQNPVGAVWVIVNAGNRVVTVAGIDLCSAQARKLHLHHGRGRASGQQCCSVAAEPALGIANLDGRAQAAMSGPRFGPMPSAGATGKAATLRPLANSVDQASRRRAETRACFTTPRFWVHCVGSPVRRSLSLMVALARRGARVFLGGVDRQTCVTRVLIRRWQPELLALV